jgi:hypothetical protein
MNMDIQTLKLDLIQWLTRLKDKNILEKINAIKDKDEELSPENQIELEKRLSKHKRGEMRFKSWDAAKASIRKRSKDAL